MRCNKKRNSLSIRVSISIKIYQRTFGETIEIFVVNSKTFLTTKDYTKVSKGLLRHPG